MKKIISTSGFGALVIALLMSSCVSKKKYVQAQQTIEKYRMDSTQMAQNAAGLQQNITSLEEKNRGVQAQLDSSKAATQAEIQRWSGLQGYYDEERTNIASIHEQLHTALAQSDVIKADEITASNGRVYITLDDQVFSGGQLSTKGKKAIADFAGVLKDKQDLVVDVASSNSYAAYWNSGSTAMGNMDTSSTTAVDASTEKSANEKHEAETAKTENAPSASVSSENNSSRPTARTSTKTHKSTATARRSSTANRSSRAAVTKSSASKSTAKKSESGRKMNFKGSSKSSNTWNSNMAKATAIAKELHKNGVYNVGLMVPGSANASDAGTSTGKKNFQLIVSPKTTRYYQMMESNKGSTSGVQ